MAAAQLTLAVTPDQLDLIGHALTVLRDRLYEQEDSAAPLEAFKAKKRLAELEPVETIVFGELNNLYAPDHAKGVAI